SNGDQTGRPLFLRTNDEQNGGRKRKHGSHHREEEQSESKRQFSREILLEIFKSKWRSEDREEHHNRDQRAGQGDNIHDSEEQEKWRVEKNGIALIVGTSGYCIGGSEDDRGNENGDGRT